MPYLAWSGKAFSLVKLPVTGSRRTSPHAILHCGIIYFFVMNINKHIAALSLFV